jgi:hypothetical protein
VAFAVGDLWTGSRTDGRDEVLCDLWECYLEPVKPGEPTRPGHASPYREDQWSRVNDEGSADER